MYYTAFSVMLLKIYDGVLITKTGCRRVVENTLQFWNDLKMQCIFLEGFIEAVTTCGKLFSLGQQLSWRQIGQITR